ncbi:MAG: hypothetical protein JST59_12195 [Actinobacteria bacterium]|nr:hypothetical protein [Actinomycetota bacterium]
MADPSAGNRTAPSPSGGTSSPLGFPLVIASLALIIVVGAALAVAFMVNGMHNGTAGSGAPGGLAHRSMMGGSPPGSMMGGASHGSMMGGAVTEGSGKVDSIHLTIKSDEEHGRLGPEGTWHDAYLPASFTVEPGDTVNVTVQNYDEGEHTFTSMPLGLAATIAAGSASHPKTTTFTFQAPNRAGNYLWFCALPCDPWAMAHIGYMRGYVRVA